MLVRWYHCFFGGVLCRIVSNTVSPFSTTCLLHLFPHSSHCWYHCLTFCSYCCHLSITTLSYYYLKMTHFECYWEWWTDLTRLLKLQSFLLISEPKPKACHPEEETPEDKDWSQLGAFLLQVQHVPIKTSSLNPAMLRPHCLDNFCGVRPDFIILKSAESM